MKQTLKFNIERIDSIDSTNDYLKQKALNGESEGKVVIAESQTRGKGQRGRIFYSPKGVGIYMSILLRPSENVFSYITRLVAVALVKSINDIANIDAKIKWVNDIYISDKKCAGILCESNIDDGYVVVGVGINVFTPNNGYDKAIKDIAVACFDGIENAKELLVEKFLNYINEYYSNFDSDFISNEYKSYSMLIGREILVLKEKPQKAVVLDINGDGALVVEYFDKKKDIIISGDIQVI